MGIIRSLRMPIIVPSHTIISGQGPQLSQAKESSIGMAKSRLNAYHALLKKCIEGVLLSPKHVYVL